MDFHSTNAFKIVVCEMAAIWLGLIVLTGNKLLDEAIVTMMLGAIWSH